MVLPATEQIMTKPSNSLTSAKNRATPAPKSAKGRKSRSTRAGHDPSGGKQPSAASKLETVVALLRRPKGTTIAELCKTTGWQSHSVRGALSGAIKGKMGLSVVSAQTAGVRIYRIAG